MYISVPPQFQIPGNANYQDLDFFLYDSKKIIHIATAGMTLPDRLREQTTLDNISNFKTVLAMRRSFKYESNNQLVRDNLTEEKSYFSFFNLMAKRGFYSYDKVNIDDSDDYTFQLISKPLYDRRILLANGHDLGGYSGKKQVSYDIQFIRAKNDFPENFNQFTLIEFI